MEKWKLDTHKTFEERHRLGAVFSFLKIVVEKCAIDVIIYKMNPKMEGNL